MSSLLSYLFRANVPNRKKHSKAPYVPDLGVQLKEVVSEGTELHELHSPLPKVVCHETDTDVDSSEDVKLSLAPPQQEGSGQFALLLPTVPHLSEVSFCLEVLQHFAGTTQHAAACFADAAPAEQLLQLCHDGILLCKLLSKSVPGSIDERAINDAGEETEGLCDEEVLENYQLFISCAEAHGCGLCDSIAIDQLRTQADAVAALVLEVLRVAVVQALPGGGLDLAPDLLVAGSSSNEAALLTSPRPVRPLPRTCSASDAGTPSADQVLTSRPFGGHGSTRSGHLSLVAPPSPTGAASWGGAPAAPAGPVTPPAATAQQQQQHQQQPLDHATMLANLAGSLEQWALQLEGDSPRPQHDTGAVAAAGSPQSAPRLAGSAPAALAATGDLPMAAAAPQAPPAAAAQAEAPAADGRDRFGLPQWERLASALLRRLGLPHPGAAALPPGTLPVLAALEGLRPDHFSPTAPLGSQPADAPPGAIAWACAPPLALAQAHPEPLPVQQSERWLVTAAALHSALEATGLPLPVQPEFLACRTPGLRLLLLADAQLAWRRAGQPPLPWLAAPDSCGGSARSSVAGAPDLQAGSSGSTHVEVGIGHALSDKGTPAAEHAAAAAAAVAAVPPGQVHPANGLPELRPADAGGAGELPASAGSLPAEPPGLAPAAGEPATQEELSPSDAAAATPMDGLDSGTGALHAAAGSPPAKGHGPHRSALVADVPHLLRPVRSGHGHDLPSGGGSSSGGGGGGRRGMDTLSQHNQLVVRMHEEREQRRSAQRSAALSDAGGAAAKGKAAGGGVAEAAPAGGGARAPVDLWAGEDEDTAGENQEERVLRLWLNSLSPSTLRVSSLFGPDMTTGWPLLLALDAMQPGCVAWSATFAPPFKEVVAKILAVQNCNHVIDVCLHKLALHLVNIGGLDLALGQRRATLSLVFQMMRHHMGVLLGLVTPGAAAAPRGQRAQVEEAVLGWANAKLAAAAVAATAAASAGQAPEPFARGSLLASTSPVPAALVPVPSAAAAGAGPAERRYAYISSFADPRLSEGAVLLQLLAAISPRAVNARHVAPGATQAERESNAKYVLSVARKLGCVLFLAWEDVAAGRPKLMLLLLASFMALDRKRQQQQQAAAQQQQQVQQ